MNTIAVTARRVVAPYGETASDCHSIWPVSFTAVLAPAALCPHAPIAL